MAWVWLALSLVVILAGAELFTNGIEWVGEAFGLSQGAVGSVLAAVGTALPETILPLIAILSGRGTGEEIGIGAILGAPFMLTTLAMFVVAVATFTYARSSGRSLELQGNQGVLRQDLGYFLVMYGLAAIAGLDPRPGAPLGTRRGAAHRLRLLRPAPLPGTGEKELEAEAGGEIKPLYLWSWLRRLRPGLPPWTVDSPSWATFVQVGAGLVLIVGGARLFVLGVDVLANRFGVSHLVFAACCSPLWRRSSPRSSTASSGSGSARTRSPWGT